MSSPLIIANVDVGLVLAFPAGCLVLALLVGCLLLEPFGPMPKGIQWTFVLLLIPVTALSVWFLFGGV